MSISRAKGLINHAIYISLAIKKKTKQRVIVVCTTLIVGRDNAVGIATLYGLDGPGIETRWGRDFPHAFIPALGPT